MSPRTWGVVLAAAGRGTRFGRPKQFVELAGKPMLAWSIGVFAAMPEVAEIVVATEPDYLPEAASLRRYAGATPIRVVAGGDDRQASVGNGLAALAKRCDGVMVHDGARPLVRAEDVRRAMRAVAPGTGALLATPCVDTIKVIESGGKVLQTLDRSTLWAAQTPQLATLPDMLEAFARAERDGVRGTDEAMLLERIGLKVLVVEGSTENFKVTYPGDLERAEAILRARCALEPAEAPR